MSDTHVSEGASQCSENAIRVLQAQLVLAKAQSAAALAREREAQVEMQLVEARQASSRRSAASSRSERAGVLAAALGEVMDDFLVLAPPLSGAVLEAHAHGVALAPYVPAKKKKVCDTQHIHTELV